MWGYDFTAFAAAGTQALAILDLVSRKWIDTLLCAEATSLQVQTLFTRALEAEGLLDEVLRLTDTGERRGRRCEARAAGRLETTARR